MLRYLRIAVTALGLTACVLLIALWVRSYDSPTSLALYFGRRAIKVDSTSDRVYVSTSTSGGGELQPYLPGRNRTQVEIEMWNRIRASESKLGFGVYHDLVLINTSTLILPHWFLILLSATAAVVPLISWSRRFSLRTLLIATTLVAVGMALVVAAA